MKNQIRKNSALILTSIMTVAAVPSVAFAAENPAYAIVTSEVLEDNTALDDDGTPIAEKIVIKIGETAMTVGDKTINLDAPAYINDENYTMLPVRAISEALNLKIDWNSETKTAVVLYHQRIISMTVGSKTMYINGVSVEMNTAAAITNDRLFIPVRDLANTIGVNEVNWSEENGTVTLNEASK